MTLPTPGSSPQTRVRRHSERSVRDRDELYAVLDAGLVVHVSFVVEGQPVVLAMGYARDGDRLLLHGSKRSRMMKLLADGAPMCAAVTLLDGLVLADSAFNHSMNYRSVVVHGRARELGDVAEKARALDLFVDFVLPGRSTELRGHTTKELATTMVLELPLDQVSLKARTGGPMRVPVPNEDGSLPWMGVIPLDVSRGEPQPLDG
jgi:hypothetical protein